MIELTATEAAARLGVSRSEIVRLANTGRLPHTRVLVRATLEYRFSPADLDAYVPAPVGNHTGRPRTRAKTASPSE